MGASGIVLYGFLLVHLVGNLGLITGPERLNQYGHLLLHTLAEIIVPAEIVLAAAFILHIVLAIQLKRENKAARPVAYANVPYHGRRTLYSTTMMISGLVIAAFVLVHISHFRFGFGDKAYMVTYNGVEMRDLYRTAMEWLLPLVVHPRLRRRLRPARLPSRPRRAEQHPVPGVQPSQVHAPPCTGPAAATPSSSRAGSRSWPSGPSSRCREGPPDAARPQDPRGDRRQEVGQAPLPHEAGEPGQQAQVQGHRGGHRPGRRLRRRDPGRARLQRACLHLAGQPPPRPQHRRPGRHQRRQELPQRRRQRPAPLLRHHQGRRLPRPRGQRVPPGPGLGEHHRPMRGPGRALRPRLRRPPRQPLLRRHPGVAHLLRPRPDGPAAPAGRLPGPDAPGRARRT